MDFIINKKKGILLILIGVFFIGLLMRYEYGFHDSIIATKLRQIIEVSHEEK